VISAENYNNLTPQTHLLSHPSRFKDVPLVLVAVIVLVTLFDVFIGFGDSIAKILISIYPPFDFSAHF